jgi:hypothetical protein
MGIVGEFNKLKQWGDVESYRCEFEEEVQGDGRKDEWLLHQGIAIG